MRRITLTLFFRDIWAKRFYHLLKARKDQLESERRHLEDLRTSSLEQGRLSYA